MTRDGRPFDPLGVRQYTVPKPTSLYRSFSRTGDPPPVNPAEWPVPRYLMEESKSGSVPLAKASQSCEPGLRPAADAGQNQTAKASAWIPPPPAIPPKVLTKEEKKIVKATEVAAAAPVAVPQSVVTPALKGTEVLRLLNNEPKSNHVVSLALVARTWVIATTEHGEDPPISDERLATLVDEHGLSFATGDTDTESVCDQDTGPGETYWCCVPPYIFKRERRLETEGNFRRRWIGLRNRKKCNGQWLRNDRKDNEFWFEPEVPSDSEGIVRQKSFIPKAGQVADSLGFIEGSGTQPRGSLK